MNLSDKDLNLFVVFDVIYTERNLTKSGEVLGITQPAVSNALSRLRENFNDELFVRTSKGMVPTPVAENMVNDIRQALDLIRNSISESESFNPKTANATFRISIGDTSEYRLLPQLIKNISNLAPGVDVESYLTPRTETPKELAAGNIDFAIDPPIHSDPNLRNKKIYQDDYVLVVNKKHPIAKKKKISLEDYLNLSHIHISKRASGLGHVDTTLNRLGLTRRIALRAQHFLVAPYIIDQSNLAMTTIKSFSRGRELKVFQLPFKINPLVLHLYWHVNKDMDPANKWMRELILKTYGKIQGKR
jgi:DNA-binding transcriptional LysR family regulator